MSRIILELIAFMHASCRIGEARRLSREAFAQGDEDYTTTTTIMNRGNLSEKSEGHKALCSRING